MPKRDDAFWTWAGVVTVMMLGQAAHWIFWRDSFDRTLAALEPIQPIFNILLLAAFIGPAVGAFLGSWVNRRDD